MFFTPLIRGPRFPFLSKGVRRTRCKATRNRHQTTPLRLEPLEDRAMLSAGALDPTFGDGGLVTTDFLDFTSDRVLDIAVQADGKIVVVGSSSAGGGGVFALARYNPDGILDTSFDGDGKLTTDFAGDLDLAFGVAIQVDGKIVAAGRSFQSGTGFDFALARYNPDGSLDTTFDGDGKVTTDFGGFFDQANAVVIQADGKIVVAGRSQSGTGVDFALARYNADGSLDITFDADGKITTDFAGSFDEATGVVIQADGKFVVAGRFRQSDSGEDFDFAMARYNDDGSLDTSFDGDGKLTTDFAGSSDGAFGLAIQADGKIVLAGRSFQSGTSFDFALARYNADGSLDTGFDGDGRVTTDFAGGDDEARGLALQADGKIVVAGRSFQSGAGIEFALARYNPDGSLDTSFDGDGKLTTDFAGSTDIALSVAIQADGKIVAAGLSTQSGTGVNFALARYIAVSSQEHIEEIIPDVQALVADGDLNNGQGTSLLAKLQAAIQVLDSDNETAAINLLQALVTQIGAFIDSGILTSAEGQPLIDAVNAIIDQLSGTGLHVAGGLSQGGNGAPRLTHELLQPVVQQAVAQWSVDGADARRLNHLDIRIADIPGTRLGVVGSSGTIWIDRDAAGYGWSMDVESRGLRVEGSGVDLLSVVTHELGHVLGFEHSDGYDVMGRTLAVGQRRLPASSLVGGSFAGDGYGSRNDLAAGMQSLDEVFSLWGVRGWASTLGAPAGGSLRSTAATVSPSHNRFFETLGAEPNHGERLDTGWTVAEDEDEADTFGRLFTRSSGRGEDPDADSENLDGDLLDEDDLDELALDELG